MATVAKTKSTPAKGGRRTQAQRRAESRQAVLDSALKLFGEKGYAQTSLDDIAADCGLTIRPIYHYFGNKQALFGAVNEVMERRILEAMRVGEGGAGLEENWRAYLDLCDDPAFCRIVLVDSPNILGRERWASSPVSEKARASLVSTGEGGSRQQLRAELQSAIFMGALTAAALAIAEADDMELAKSEAAHVMAPLFSALRGQVDPGR